MKHLTRSDMKWIRGQKRTKDIYAKPSLRFLLFNFSCWTKKNYMTSVFRLNKRLRKRIKFPIKGTVVKSRLYF